MARFPNLHHKFKNLSQWNSTNQSDASPTSFSLTSMVNHYKSSSPVRLHPPRFAPAGPVGICRHCVCRWRLRTAAVCGSLWRPEGSLCSSSGLCGRWWTPGSPLHSLLEVYLQEQSEQLNMEKITWMQFFFKSLIKTQIFNYITIWIRDVVWKTISV